MIRRGVIRVLSWAFDVCWEAHEFTLAHYIARLLTKLALR